MKEQPSPSSSLSDFPLVIFAEDDDEDWLLMEEALKDCDADLRIERVRDGLELLERLRKGPDPALVMLDLRMPKKDGAEVLREIRQDAELRFIPVIVMTTSSRDSDIFKAYFEGANSYVVKPVTFELMAKALRELHKYWTQVVALPRRPAPAGA